MEEIHSSGKALPIRQADDGTWEVLNMPEHWTSCDTEADARRISNAPLILERSFQAVYPDESIAAQLDETAEILAKYNIGFGSRFFHNRAKLARGEETED